MIEVKLSSDIVHEATEKSAEMGRLNNSITGGAGNIAGFIGERIVADFLGEGAAIRNTYDYDIVFEDITIDVKTKRTTVAPKPYYECSVAKLNTTQKCDVYAFTRVSKDLSTAWILGFKDKMKYFEEATMLTRGEVDPSNNFTVKSDCYNLRIDELDL